LWSIPRNLNYHGDKLAILNDIAPSNMRSTSKSTNQVTLQSAWKKDFPALANGNICYLDSAATCQVPKQVINDISGYLSNGQGNAGRGMYAISEAASDRIGFCRSLVADFIQCSIEQIIFTKGTTESINFVAASLRAQLSTNHSILVTEMEHHTNLLPWQRLCQQTGARLNILPLTQNGELSFEKLEDYLQDNCALFAFTHCSNILGHLNPIEYLITAAKKHGVKTLIDGAQSIPHTPIDLSKLDCDYFAFSGHKLYATSGSGVLFCKDPDQLEPLLLGGGIAAKTTTKQFHLSDSISRFEAGTSNISALVGLSSAISYFQSIGYQKIAAHEKKLHDYLSKKITTETQFKIISHTDSHSLVSFYSDQIHCHDVASILAEDNIAIRAGHHCAQPCLNALGYKHCLRASVGLYNDYDDINQLINGLKKVQDIFA